MIVFGGEQATPRPVADDSGWGGRVETVGGDGTPTDAARTSLGDLRSCPGSHARVRGDGTTNVWELPLGGNPIWNCLQVTGTPPAARTGHTAIYDSDSRPYDRVRRVRVERSRCRLRDQRRVGAFAIGPSDMDPAHLERPLRPCREAAALRHLRPDSRPHGGLRWRSAIPELLQRHMGPSRSRVRRPGRSYPRAGDPHWRYSHSAVYDALQDRMVVYGGTTDQSVGGKASPRHGHCPCPERRHGSCLDPSSPAGPRWGHTAVLDPMDDRMLVFSGVGNYYLPDCWSMSLKDPQGGRVLAGPPAAGAAVSGVCTLRPAPEAADACSAGERPSTS